MMEQRDLQRSKLALYLYIISGALTCQLLCFQNMNKTDLFSQVRRELTLLKSKYGKKLVANESTHPETAAPASYASHQVTNGYSRSTRVFLK